MKLRLFLLTVTLPVLPGWLLYWRCDHLPRYYSNWANVVLVLSLLLSITMPYDLLIHRKPGRLLATHFSISLAAFMQLLAVPVFFLLLQNEFNSRNTHGQ